MPTKKRRVGFIPRDDVLEIINKLSYETNLSYSKIINILVEEALFKRGLFNIMKSEVLQLENIDNKKNSNLKNKGNVNEEFQYNFKNKIPAEKNLKFIEVKNQILDNEIYTKFLMFLQFQERMKNET